MYTIRTLESKDIHKVMEIWKESTMTAHPFIEKNYWENNYDTVKNVYLPISDTFVYEDGEKIKGFISIIDNAFIGALFVDVHEQGLGIGSKLMDYVVAKYEKLSLAVYKENTEAVTFYKNKGFKIMKEQENEDSGYSEYVMENTYLE